MDETEEVAASKAGVFGKWKLHFDATTHRYTIRDRQTDELVDTGGIRSTTEYASSMFSAFNPDDALQVMRSTTRTQRYTGLTDDEIKAFWKGNGRHAADLGTLAHAYMERCMNMEMETPGSLFGKEIDAYPEPPQPRCEDYAAISQIIPEQLRDTSGIAIRRETPVAFFKYVKCLGYKPLYAELMMYDHEMCISGTVDAVFQHGETGDVWIVDWKRRKEFKLPDVYSVKGTFGTPAESLFSSHYSMACLQLNIYRGIILRSSILGAAKVVRLSIVSIHPMLVDTPADAMDKSLTSGQHTPELYSLHDIPIDDLLVNAIVVHRRSR